MVCQTPRASGEANSILVGEKFFKQGDGWCVPNAFYNSLASSTVDSDPIQVSLPLSLWNDNMVSLNEFAKKLRSSSALFIERVKCDISKCHRWNSVSQGERYCLCHLCADTCQIFAEVWHTLCCTGLDWRGRQTHRFWFVPDLSLASHSQTPLFKPSSTGSLMFARLSISLSVLWNRQTLLKSGEFAFATSNVKKRRSSFDLCTSLGSFFLLNYCCVGVS